VALLAEDDTEAALLDGEHAQDAPEYDDVDENEKRLRLVYLRSCKM
jgi:hypothetical protein